MKSVFLDDRSGTGLVSALSSSMGDCSGGGVGAGVRIPALLTGWLFVSISGTVGLRVKFDATDFRCPRDCAVHFLGAERGNNFFGRCGDMMC